MENFKLYNHNEQTYNNIMQLWSNSTNKYRCADGYPFIQKYMKVSKLEIIIAIRAYHHNNWDFYIDDIEKIEC